jgi:membrane AbrB-like protein
MSAGAAAAMTLMSESYGADMRMVALMQYLRVVIVVVVSSIVAHFWVGTAASAAPAAPWFGATAWGPFAWTLVLTLLGAQLGQTLRLPAGSLLLPLAAGAVLQAGGWLSIELPRWFLALAYAGLGWTIGLRFTRDLLVHAARSLPVIIAAILALVLVCGGLAVLLTCAGIDPLTAYLATSPGGADSVAIIAASSNVDVPFVIGLQTARLVIVILIGPSIARFMSALMERERERDPG